MRKEQILLLVAVALSALVVWGNTGQYESLGVEAGHFTGVKLRAQTPTQYDFRTGLSDKALPVRSLVEQHRTDERPPLPDLVAPEALAPRWVLPI